MNEENMVMDWSSSTSVEASSTEISTEERAIVETPLIGVSVVEAASIPSIEVCVEATSSGILIEIFGVPTKRIILKRPNEMEVSKPIESKSTRLTASSAIKPAASSARVTVNEIHIETMKCLSSLKKSSWAKTPFTFVSKMLFCAKRKPQSKAKRRRKRKSKKMSQWKSLMSGISRSSTRIKILCGIREFGTDINARRSNIAACAKRKKEDVRRRCVVSTPRVTSRSILPTLATHCCSSFTVSSSFIAETKRRRQLNSSAKNKMSAVPAKCPLVQMNADLVSSVDYQIEDKQVKADQIRSKIIQGVKSRKESGIVFKYAKISTVFCSLVMFISNVFVCGIEVKQHLNPQRKSLRGFVQKPDEEGKADETTNPTNEEKPTSPTNSFHEISTNNNVPTDTVAKVGNTATKTGADAGTETGSTIPTNTATKVGNTATKTGADAKTETGGAIPTNTATEIGNPGVIIGTNTDTETDGMGKGTLKAEVGGVAGHHTPDRPEDITHAAEIPSSTAEIPSITAETGRNMGTNAEMDKNVASEINSNTGVNSNARAEKIARNIKTNDNTLETSSTSSGNPMISTNSFISTSHLANSPMAGSKSTTGLQNSPITTSLQNSPMAGSTSTSLQNFPVTTSIAKKNSPFLATFSQQSTFTSDHNSRSLTNPVSLMQQNKGSNHDAFPSTQQSKDSNRVDFTQQSKAPIPADNFAHQKQEKEPRVEPTFTQQAKKSTFTQQLKESRLKSAFTQQRRADCNPLESGVGWVAATVEDTFHNYDEAHPCMIALEDMATYSGKSNGGSVIKRVIDGGGLDTGNWETKPEQDGGYVLKADKQYIKDIKDIIKKINAEIEKEDGNSGAGAVKPAALPSLSLVQKSFLVDSNDDKTNPKVKPKVKSESFMSVDRKESRIGKISRKIAQKISHKTNHRMRLAEEKNGLFTNLCSTWTGFCEGKKDGGPRHNCKVPRSDNESRDPHSIVLCWKTNKCALSRVPREKWGTEDKMGPIYKDSTDEIESDPDFEPQSNDSLLAAGWNRRDWGVDELKIRSSRLQNLREETYGKHMRVMLAAIYLAYESDIRENGEKDIQLGKDYLKADSSITFGKCANLATKYWQYQQKFDDPIRMTEQAWMCYNRIVLQTEDKNEENPETLSSVKERWNSLTKKGTGSYSSGSLAGKPLTVTPTSEEDGDPKTTFRDHIYWRSPEQTDENEYAGRVNFGKHEFYYMNSLDAMTKSETSSLPLQDDPTSSDAKGKLDMTRPDDLRCIGLVIRGRTFEHSKESDEIIGSKGDSSKKLADYIIDTKTKPWHESSWFLEATQKTGNRVSNEKKPEEWFKLNPGDPLLVNYVNQFLTLRRFRRNCRIIHKGSSTLRSSIPQELLKVILFLTGTLRQRLWARAGASYIAEVVEHPNGYGQGVTFPGMDKNSLFSRGLDFSGNTKAICKTYIEYYMDAVVELKKRFPRMRGDCVNVVNLAARGLFFRDSKKNQDAIKKIIVSHSPSPQSTYGPFVLKMIDDIEADKIRTDDHSLNANECVAGAILNGKGPEGKIQPEDTSILTKQPVNPLEGEGVTWIVDSFDYTFRTKSKTKSQQWPTGTVQAEQAYKAKLLYDANDNCASRGSHDRHVGNERLLKELGERANKGHLHESWAQQVAKVFDDIDKNRKVEDMYHNEQKLIMENSQYILAVLVLIILVFAIFAMYMGWCDTQSGCCLQCVSFLWRNKLGRSWLVCARNRTVDLLLMLPIYGESAVRMFRRHCWCGPKKGKGKGKKGRKGKGKGGKGKRGGTGRMASMLETFGTTMLQLMGFSDHSIEEASSFLEMSGLTDAAYTLDVVASPVYAVQDAVNDMISIPVNGFFYPDDPFVNGFWDDEHYYQE